MSSQAFLAAVAAPSTPSGSPKDVVDKAHHNTKGKGFVNPWPSYTDFTGPAIMGKLIWRAITGKYKSPDTTPPTVPVHKPSFLPTRETANLRATWLGHAAFYIEFPGGLRALFDPVFTERCSPFTFMGPKRYTEMPCDVEDLPFVDAVCISHNHYDHLSHPTIMRIAKKYEHAHFFVPLGNKPWFEKCGVSATRVTEMDWWEEKELKLTPKSDAGDAAGAAGEISARVGCLPCQHTSARTPFDKSHTLWASWSIRSGGKNVYFAGDTGYRAVPMDLPKEVFDYGDDYKHLPHCPAFKQIGDLRGPFDLGMIPIGAYDPRFIMSPMHCNPYDSVNVFVDTKCDKALGMHWGTWVLTQEEVMEPPRLLKDALKWKGVEKGDDRFGVCDIGESREY